jgi:hypothetical protein
MCRGIVGAQRQCLVGGAERLLILLELEQHARMICMGFERSWIDAQSLADEPVGLGEITALAGEDAHHVQRVELLRVL